MVQFSSVVAQFSCVHSANYNFFDVPDKCQANSKFVRTSENSVRTSTKFLIFLPDSYYFLFHKIRIIFFDFEKKINYIVIIIVCVKVVVT